jgi:hypothetical protein
MNKKRTMINVILLFVGIASTTVTYFTSSVMAQSNFNPEFGTPLPGTPIPGDTNFNEGPTEFGTPLPGTPIPGINN